MATKTATEKLIFTGGAEFSFTGASLFFDDHRGKQEIAPFLVFIHWKDNDGKERLRVVKLDEAE